MCSVEKIETTLRILKSNNQFSSFAPNEASRGLSSGNLKVTKTDSELCIRPCSPDRYKSICDLQQITPSTKQDSFKDSQSSFQEFSELQKIFQTPAKDLSLYLELDVEEVIDTSFFSSADDAKELEIFKDEQKNEDLHSFASTRSKTERPFEDFVKDLKSQRKNYRNNCRILCVGCKEVINTDVRIVHQAESFFAKIWCSLCVFAERKLECTYFCSKCKRFLTFCMDDLEFNLN